MQKGQVEGKQMMEYTCRVHPDDDGEFVVLPTDAVGKNYKMVLAAVDDDDSVSNWYWW